MDAFKALFADVPSISIVYIRSLIELGKEDDVTLLPLCQELGISDSLLSSADGAVSINQFLNLMEQADLRFPDSNWSVRLGLSWGLQIHGMTALPLFHRDNPFAIAHLALNYLALRLPLVELVANRDGDDLVIDLKDNWPLGKVRERVLELYFGVLVRFVSQMGKSFTLCLESAGIAHMEAISELHGCEIRTHHPRNQLMMHGFSDGNFMPASTVPQKAPTTRMSPSSQTMLLLIRRLVTVDPGRSCTIERVAEKLGSTPRTLSRYLRAASMSFSELRNGVRAQHAERYLRESTLPIIDIAERLGYSDQASFSKAFRSWTGKTPGEFRRTSKAEMSADAINKNKKRA